MVNVFNYMDNFIFVISLNRKIKFTNKAVMNKPLRLAGLDSFYFM